MATENSDGSVTTGPKILLPPETPKPVPERMLAHFVVPLGRHGQPDVIELVDSLAYVIAEQVQSGPERTVALRKLLEARDALQRATDRPGC